MADLGQYDASDPVAIDNAGKEAARREAEDRETIRVWMSHPKGRDLLYRMMEACDIFGSPFVAGEPDTTAYRCGAQNMGKQLLLIPCQYHADLYMKMMNEQQIEREGRNVRLLKQNKNAEERNA